MTDSLGVQVWFIVAGVAMVVMAAGALVVSDVTKIEDQGRSRLQAAEPTAATGGAVCPASDAEAELVS